MVGICYSIFTKGKQFGAVHLLSYTTEKAAVFVQGRRYDRPVDMNDRQKQASCKPAGPASIQTSQRDASFALGRAWAQGSAKAGEGTGLDSLY